MKVLLVDSSVELQQLAHDTAPALGLDVIAVDDVAGARHALETHGPFKFIVSSWHHGDLSLALLFPALKAGQPSEQPGGHQLCRDLRSAGDETPVLIFTGADRAGVLQDLHQAGLPLPAHHVWQKGNDSLLGVLSFAQHHYGPERPSSPGSRNHRSRGAEPH